MGLRLDVAKDQGAFSRRDSILLSVNGKEEELEFCTEGWEEALAEWKSKNPEPVAPFREVVVRPGDPDAKRIRLRRGIATIRKYDPDGSEFQSRLRAWEDRTYYAVAAHCLVGLELELGGEPITDLCEKVEGLIALGFSSVHARQLGLMVISLSSLADKEDAEDFDVPSEPESD